MRDAYEKFREHGIELYAISYDDQKVLSEFASKQNIPFRLLSDVDSSVIRAYGILNEQVTEEAGPIFGIPYPGVYVTDEDGVVVAKFFHDTYKKRDSPEILIDAAMVIFLNITQEQFEETCQYSLRYGVSQKVWQWHLLLLAGV